MRTAESNFCRLALYYQNNNAKDKLSLDRVSFHNKQPDANIQITYLTMPGFKQKPLYLFVQGPSVQYVPDAFNKRYGKSNNLKNTGLDFYWENDEEIATLSLHGNGEELIILDKKLYKTMVQFVVPEVRKIAAEQKAQQKAAEEAKKGGI